MPSLENFGQPLQSLHFELPTGKPLQHATIGYEMMFCRLQFRR